MKKALIVSNMVGFVGFLWNDINVLKNLGYEISYASNSDIDGENHVKELQNAGIKFYPLMMTSKNPISKGNFISFMKLKRIMKEEHFDIVHCHTPIAGLIARVAAKKYRKKGIKVLYTTHGFSFTHLSSPKQWMIYHGIEKFASKYTDVIITINQEDYGNVCRLLCRDVRMINGVGVDTAIYRDVAVDIQDYKKKLGLPTDKIMVLSVGEISARKNHQIIIKALGELQNKENYIYVICGRENGSYELTNHLKQLAREKGVALYLLGHRDDIPQITHCSDIGAIPSIREGLGLAGIQSLCAGVPLVGTRVQEIKDYIIDGVDGFLYDPYDEKGYAEGIRRLSDRSVREMMRNDCVKIASQYDISISHRQMSEIYTSILK